MKRGKLQVVADDSSTVFATLAPGTVFGEISILNIAGKFYVPYPDICLVACIDITL